MYVRIMSLSRFTAINQYLSATVCHIFKVLVLEDMYDWQEGEVSFHIVYMLACIIAFINLFQP